MSLNGSGWVDHGSHGDRHERDASVRTLAAQGFSGGDGGVRFRPSRTTRGATRTSRRCSSALSTRSSSGRKGLVLRYLGRTTGYSRQHLTRLVRQCLATGGLTKRYRPPAQGFAPKVHGRRCGAPGRDRRPPRHALGTRHPAIAAARFVGLRGHPHCAAGVDLGGASLPPAGRRRRPGAPPTGDQDAPHRHRSGSAVGDRGHLASGSPRPTCCR